MGCMSTKDGGKGGTGGTGGSTAAASQKKSGTGKGKPERAHAVDNPGKILEFYSIDSKKLGEGSYGSVSKAKSKSTGAVRAVKTISKSQMKNTDRFKQEIDIMKMMDHPNIIKLYETFDDHRNIYLVMELCTGGELFDRIIDAGHFTEVQAAIIVQQIIRAIFYMHENHVCHRDLKPENFLFVSKEPIEKSTLKIIDFGLSCEFAAGQVLTTKAGTPYYVAPQVLAGKYDQQSDLWSCGVIMYVMLCGYPPFFGETDAEVLSKVRLGNFSFNAADWKTVSEDAKNLIRLLLKMNPRDRYTASQALAHDWVKNKAPAADPTISLTKGHVDNLRGFRSQNKLKKVALQVIATNLNDEQIKSLREVFTQLDGNGDGKLSSAELKTAIEKANIPNIPEGVAEILKEVDSDGSGEIDYTEFLAATLDKRMYIQEDVCWAAFRVFDKNGDGKISAKELEEVLGDTGVQQFGANTADLLKELDADNDGEINFQEFMKMMKGGDTVS